jgi:hypothetical protein
MEVYKRITAIKKRVPGRKKGEASNFTKKKPDEWVKIQQSMPPSYKLVKILYENNSEYPAWWTGNRWESARFLPDLEIKSWKSMNPIGVG